MADPQTNKRLERVENMMLTILNREYESTGKLYTTSDFDPEPEPVSDVWNEEKSKDTERIVKLLTKAIDRTKLTLEENKELNEKLGAVIDHNW